MKYKIAVFSENSSYGGISSYCFDLCKILLKKGIDVTLIIPLDKRIQNKVLIEQSKSECIPIKTINIDDNFIKVSKTIINYIKDNHFNIVHTNGYRLNTLIRIGRFLFSRKETFYHIVSVHSALPYKYSTKNQILYAIINNLGNRYNHKTIAVSDYTKRYIQKNSWGAKLDICTIYNSISYESNKNSSISKIKSGDIITISFLGRLSSEKGVLFLCDIINNYLSSYPTSNVRFEICGSGKFDKMIELLQKKNPEKIIYKGFVQNTQRQLDRTDILILTSKIETFGLVLIEAALHDAAVIATNVGGVPEIIQSDYNGILIKYGDVGSYVEAIQELVLNRIKRQYFIENFKKIIERDFTLERNIDNYIKLLNSLPMI